MSPELSRQTQTRIAHRLRSLLPEAEERLPSRLEFALARLQDIDTVRADGGGYSVCIGSCLTHVLAQAGRREAGRTVVIIAMAIERAAETDSSEA